MTRGKVSRSHDLERTRKPYIFFWLINELFSSFKIYVI